MAEEGAALVRVLGGVVIAVPFMVWLVWALIVEPVAVPIALGIIVGVGTCTLGGLWLMERHR